MKKIQVTIVYALPNIQYIKTVDLQIGSTVKDALLASNLFNEVNNIKLYKNNIGIYNEQVHLNKKIKNKDRIEIYRNLIVDPKERRRNKHFFLKNKKI